MDDLFMNVGNVFDNEVNKQLLAGQFPNQKLYPVPINQILPLNIEDKAVTGIKLIKACPEFTVQMIRTCRLRYDEIKRVYLSEFVDSYTNVAVNAYQYYSTFSLLDKIQEDLRLLHPCVTDIDKALWTIVWSYMGEINLGCNSSEIFDLYYGFLYLLRNVIDKENKYSLTIDLNKLSSKSCIASIILGSWDASSGNKYLCNLDSKTKNAINAIEIKRNRMLDVVLLNSKIGYDTALKTQNEWAQFINILNDLAFNETKAVSTINSSTSARDKLNAIYDYERLITGIEHGHYMLNGNEIQLLPILDAVNKRIEKAYTYCTVTTDTSTPFILTMAAFALSFQPTTYNHLFMAYHLFRLKPNRENAKSFFDNALVCIKRNLGIQVSSVNSSLDDIVHEFRDIVYHFVEEHNDTIQHLSFAKIQKDAAVVNGMTSMAIGSGPYYEELCDKVSEIRNSAEYQEILYKTCSGHIVAFSNEQLAEQKEKEEKKMQASLEMAIARQIIVSLNTIYLFCDALRISLNNSHANIRLKDPITTKKYRHELMSIDSRLINIVYGNLDSNEIGMLEYRENAGIDAQTMSEQEREVEQYRNMVFSDILKGAIEELLRDLESQDESQLLETKKRIKEEILQYPGCDEKEMYVDWLDGISEKISQAVVNKCRTSNEFSLIYTELEVLLGKGLSVLPKGTVDSLVTAELLYKKYATNTFATQGFDYSCISALYYQAFEEAYNTLIWQKYATMLNSLKIGDIPFVTILTDNRGKKLTDPASKGYLDANPRYRDYYIEYKGDPSCAIVKERCMYKSFSIILKNAINKMLPNFASYISKLFGFNSVDDMYSDNSFMGQLASFQERINNSTEYRNNASHGGMTIAVDQCERDKNIVLNEIGEVRNDSLGLIQMLVSLSTRFQQ